MCPYCKSANEGRSPTGDWCNDCGWASPGYTCKTCGREGVNERHKAPDGKGCFTGPNDPVM